MTYSEIIALYIIFGILGIYGLYSLYFVITWIIARD